jgi:hypothetical protein
MASAFQRLGVAAGNLVDPFAMMNQSITDPSGLQDSLINIGKKFTEFNKETGKFTISREGVLRLREIEQEAGLASGSLSKAGLAAAELDARVSQISPSIKFKNEEDKQYLANIGRMGEGGKYEVELTPGSGLYKDLSDLNQQEIDKLIETQKKEPKTMEDIARSQMKLDELLLADVKTIKNTLLYGAASQRAIQREYEGVRAVTEATTGAVSGKMDTKYMRTEVFEPLGDAIRGKIFYSHRKTI